MFALRGSDLAGDHNNNNNNEALYSATESEDTEALVASRESWVQRCLWVNAWLDFAGGGPGANIEDGSSLIIHWSSGSHKRSTNWANQYDIYYGGAPTGGGTGSWPAGPLNPALGHWGGSL